MVRLALAQPLLLEPQPLLLEPQPLLLEPQQAARQALAIPLLLEPQRAERQALAIPLQSQPPRGEPRHQAPTKVRAQLRLRALRGALKARSRQPAVQSVNDRGLR